MGGCPAPTHLCVVVCWLVVVVVDLEQVADRPTIRTAKSQQTRSEEANRRDVQFPSSVSLSFFFFPTRQVVSLVRSKQKAGVEMNSNRCRQLTANPACYVSPPLAWPDPSPRLQLAAAACAACCCVLLQRAPQATTRWALPALGERVCELTPPFHSIPLPSELPRAFLLL